MEKILTRFSPPPENNADGTIERFPIHVILEDIRSLYNVGAIFRTADAARIACLHLVGITGRPPRKEIAKTALGAQGTVPWEYHPTAHSAIEQMKSRNIQVIAIEHTTGSVPLWTAEFQFPVCFVLGYEVEGIRQKTLDNCDFALEIPMYGFKGSLNVATACAIVMYESLRRLKCRV